MSNRNITFRLGLNTDDLRRGLSQAVDSAKTYGRISGQDFRKYFGNPFQKNPVTVDVDTKGAEREVKGLVNKIRQSFSQLPDPVKEIFTGMFRDIGANIASTLRSAVSGAISMVQQLSARVIEVGSRAENTRLKLATMLGEEKGKKAYNVMQEYASTTPFADMEVAESGTMLLNALPKAKEDANELARVLKMVGEVAAGSGNNIKDIATIFMQVNAVGKATNGDMLQLAQRGVPIYQELSSMLGKTVGEVQDMISKSEISSDQFMEAIQNMTTGTGVYAGMVEKLADTFEGRMSNIQGAIDKGFIAVFDAVKPAIDTVLQGLLNSMDVGAAFEGVMQELAKASEDVVNFMKQNPEVLNDMIKFGAELVSGVFTSLLQTARGIFEWLSQNPALLEVIAGLGKGIQITVDLIGKGYQFWGWTLAQTSKVIMAIVNLCRNIWDATKETRDVLSEISSITGGAISAAFNTINNTTRYWLDAINNAVSRLTNIPDIMGKIIDAAKSVNSAISSWFQRSDSETGNVNSAGGHNAGINTNGIRAFAPTGRPVGNSMSGFTDANGRQSHHRGEDFARDIQLRHPNGSYTNVPIILQEDVKILNKGYERDGAGHYATIQDSRGIGIQLMHLARAIEHNVGDTVKAGTIFGIQGKTGRTIGNEPGGGYTHLDIRTTSRTARGLSEFLLNNFSDRAMAGGMKSATNSGGANPPTTAQSTSTSSSPNSTTTTTTTTTPTTTPTSSSSSSSSTSNNTAQRDAERAAQDRQREAEAQAKQQAEQAANRTRLSQEQAIEAARIAVDAATGTDKITKERDLAVLREQANLAGELEDLKSKLEAGTLTQGDYNKFSAEAKKLSTQRLSAINKDYLDKKAEIAAQEIAKQQEEFSKIAEQRLRNNRQMLDLEIEEFQLKERLNEGTLEGLKARENANRLRAVQRFNSDIDAINSDQLRGALSESDAQALRVRAEAMFQKNLAVIKLEADKAVQEMRNEKQKITNEILQERLRAAAEYRQQVRERTFNSSMTMAQSNLALSEAQAEGMSGNSQVFAQRENARQAIRIDLSQQIYQLEELHRNGTLTNAQLELAKNNLMAIAEINLENVNTQFLTLEQTLMQGFVQSFGSALEGLILGTKSLGDAVRDVIGSMAQMLAQMAVRQLMGSLFPGIPGMASGGLVGAAAKERGLSGSEPILAMLNRDELVLNSKQAKALKSIPGFSRGTAPSLNIGSLQGAGGVHINIPIEINGGAGGINPDSLRGELENVVTGVILKHQRNGGLLRS